MSSAPTHGTYHARRVTFREYRRAYPLYPALAQYLITRFEPGLDITLNVPHHPVHPDTLTPEEQTWLSSVHDSARAEGLTPHQPTLSVTHHEDGDRRTITAGASTATAALYRMYQASDAHEGAAAYTLDVDGCVIVAQNTGAIFTANLPSVTHGGVRRTLTYIGGQGQPSRLIYALIEQRAAPDTALNPSDWDALRAAHLHDMDAHLIDRRIVTLE